MDPSTVPTDVSFAANAGPARLASVIAQKTTIITIATKRRFSCHAGSKPYASDTATNASTVGYHGRFCTTIDHTAMKPVGSPNASRTHA